MIYAHFKNIYLLLNFEHKLILAVARADVFISHNFKVKCYIFVLIYKLA